MEDNINELTLIRIGFLGDTLVGKSAIIKFIIGQEFNEDISLMLSDKHEIKFKVKNNKEIKLYIFDYLGQERYRSNALTFMKSVQGIILTVDLTQRESFNNLINRLDDIKENLNDPLIVLFGNKADMDREDWKVTSEEASKFAKEMGIAYFETSAKTGQGINEGLSYLVNDIYNKIIKISDNNIKLYIKPNKNFNCAGNKKGKNNKK